MGIQIFNNMTFRKSHYVKILLQKFKHDIRKKGPRIYDTSVES